MPQSLGEGLVDSGRVQADVLLMGALAARLQAHAVVLRDSTDFAW